VHANHTIHCTFFTTTTVAIAVAVFAFLRFYVLAKLSIVASTRVHDDLLQSVVSATPQFFDRTPVGRVLNRFSK
jgi:ABC-type multidrug transport system fused ATPase/permease subunit